VKAKWAPAAANYGLPLLPTFGEDFTDDLGLDRMPGERKRHVSASSQRRYTEERLYRPRVGPPGSTADLQARLEALKKENKAFRDENREREKTKRPSRSKHALYRDSSIDIAAEIS